MPFTKVGTNTYKSPSGRKFTKAQVKMYYATDGFKKKKVPIVKKKLKGALGITHFDKKNKAIKIEINTKHKQHKDKAELASTIKHELYHAKYPKATEKETYKATRKSKISQAEQNTLIAKLRTKTLNYKGGAIKRKFKMGRNEAKPGDMISKMNESKQSNIKSKSNNLSKQKLAIYGLV